MEMMEKNRFYHQNLFKVHIKRVAIISPGAAGAIVSLLVLLVSCYGAQREHMMVIIIIWV